MSIIEFNRRRLSYIMKLLALSEQKILDHVNGNRPKHPLEKSEVFNNMNSISLSVLKKIAELCEKDYGYFLEPLDPPDSTKSHSILFRTSVSDLSSGDRKVIAKLEERIANLRALSVLSDFPIEKKLPEYSLYDDARQIAYNLRETLYPQQSLNDKKFLKDLMNILAEQNIFVFEYVETWNKKDKTQMEGCCIFPQTIGIKRQQASFKREIFTLVHEFAHCLLGIEQLEKRVYETSSISVDKKERWCNEFAFHFLLGKEGYQQLMNIPSSEIDVENSEIKNLSSELHISRLAIYTNRVLNNIISWGAYERLKGQLVDEYAEQKKAQKSQEKDKQKGRAPQALPSPMEEKVYQMAFYQGAVEEWEILHTFNDKARQRMEI